MLSAISLQRQTLRLYGELRSRADDLGGKLIFAIGEKTIVSGLPAAASIAGAASLIVDPDLAATKAVFRNGGVDFVVNTLDEALRVLKNQIRQHRPLSVALTAAPEAVLAEILDRGVLPDFHVEIIPKPIAARALSAGLRTLQEQGMSRIRLERKISNSPSDDSSILRSHHLEEWLSKRNWHDVWIEAPTAVALRELDEHLLTQFNDPARAQWLRRIAQYQRPTAASGRALWLTAAEEASLSLPSR
jgi:hypothetical protein